MGVGVGEGEGEGQGGSETSDSVPQARPFHARIIPSQVDLESNSSEESMPTAPAAAGPYAPPSFPMSHSNWPTRAGSFVTAGTDAATVAASASLPFQSSFHGSGAVGNGQPEVARMRSFVRPVPGPRSSVASKAMNRSLMPLYPEDSNAELPSPFHPDLQAAVGNNAMGVGKRGGDLPVGAYSTGKSMGTSDGASPVKDVSGEVVRGPRTPSKGSGGLQGMHEVGMEEGRADDGESWSGEGSEEDFMDLDVASESEEEEEEGSLQQGAHSAQQLNVTGKLLSMVVYRIVSAIAH